MEGTNAAAIRIRLLGRFEIARGDCVLRSAGWSRRKAATLVQRLAVERRLLKDQAIEFLWPEADLASGANNLYRTLHAVRQTLDLALGPGGAAATFRFADGVLSLGEHVWVDVHEFEQLCGTAPTLDQAAQRTCLEQALALYQGALLPDELYADWTSLPREALRIRHRQASLALAAILRDSHDYSGAIALLTPLLGSDPADEPVHREIMRLYALAGRRHEALRQYQACLQALQRELDVPPEPATAALYAQIIAGALAAPAASSTVPRATAAAVIPETPGGPPLAGRQSELEQLRAWLHAARDGQGRTILLAGDSGVGKTRLAHEVLRAAAAAGITTLLGAAYEQEGQLAYQPFIEAFDRYLADQRRSADENPLTHFQRRGLSDPQQEQWALFNATAAFLTAITPQAPVVLLVDDLHAADEACLQLFHYLARQTRAAPIVLLAIYRSDFVSPATTPFAALLSALYRERLSETMHLAPLPAAAVASIISHMLAGSPTAELEQAIFGITEGNPFFVEEVTRALLKLGQLEEQAGRWRLRPGTELGLPDDLAGLVRERVRRLGAPVEAALAAAAVIGREFRFDVLRGVVDASDSELLDVLDVALAGRVLEETADGYRFRHPLTRRALYDALSRPRQARLHGRVAETSEVLGARRAEGLDPLVEDLAFHFDRSDQRDRALSYLLRAGEKAAAMYAFEIAVGYFERALALMDTLNMADPARRWTICETLGVWETLLADTPRAVAHFEQALALAPQPGWRPARHERARVHRVAAMALLTAGDAAAAETHLRAALALIDREQNAPDYVYVLYNLAQLHWHRNEYQQAFAVAQQSLALAERLNDATAIAHAYEMLALACHSLGAWQSGINFEQQRAALAGPSLDVTEAFDVHL